METHPDSAKPPANPLGVYRPVIKSVLGSIPNKMSGARYPECQLTQPPVIESDIEASAMNDFVWSDLQQRRPVIPAKLTTMLWGHFDQDYDKALELSRQSKTVFPITRAIAEKHGKWFKEIQAQVPPASKIFHGKNRWSNILPNEVYRVPIMKQRTNDRDITAGVPIITTADGRRFQEDFVSASDVLPIANLEGLTQSYIACQAPTHKTIADTWEMIWQQHVEVIVMLTRFAEQNASNGTMNVREKAIPYWPLYVNGKNASLTRFSSPARGSARTGMDDSVKIGSDDSPRGVDLINLKEAEVGATERYGNYNVEVKQITHSGESTLRTFEVRNLNDPTDPTGQEMKNKRTVRLLHFEGWGDHSLPDVDGFFTMFRAYRLLRKSQVIAQSPILVHCSAGIGRTGTFIGIDMMLDHIRHNTKNGLPTDLRQVVNVIAGLRTCRPGMVQTDGQYSFIYWFLQYCYNHPKKEAVGL